MNLSHMLMNGKVSRASVLSVAERNDRREEAVINLASCRSAEIWQAVQTAARKACIEYGLDSSEVLKQFYLANLAAESTRCCEIGLFMSVTCSNGAEVFNRIVKVCAKPGVIIQSLDREFKKKEGIPVLATNSSTAATAATA